MLSRKLTLRSAACVAVLVAMLSPMSGSLHAQSALGPVASSSVPASVPKDVLAGPLPCDAPKALSKLDGALNQTARKLAANEAVTIVAVGSSSTAGAGASSPAFSYPSRLATELKARFPRANLKILNRGVNGDEVGTMLARLDATVLAEQPTLVLWQLGTNAVLRDQNADDAVALAREGVARIKASGADLVLVDSHYAPRVLAKPALHEMLELIDSLGRHEHVPVFHRFAVMRHWHDQQAVPMESFITPDGLHMNDWGYACFARVLAGSLADAIARGQAVANATAPTSRPSDSFMPF